MKITEVKTFIMRGIARNWLFVKVLTDEGIHGWGEGTLEGQEKTVGQAIQTLGAHIVGQDPTRIERLWQMLYRHGFWRGGVVLNSALSAIDIALWDIQGKALGGPIRDHVRAYSHADTPEQAKKVAAEGFTGIKTGGWYINEGIDERQVSARLRERIAAIRQFRAVEEFNLLFFEEPVPPDNLDALAQVRRESIKVDLATGERLFTRRGFKDLLVRLYSMWN